MPVIKSWARTDVGHKRKHNEDSFLVDEALGLYAVADGMGGHAAGEHHTIGMKFPIDVVFLNRGNAVVGLVQGMAPCRLSSIHFTSYSVLELPTGTIKKSRTEVGDQFEISLAEKSEIDDLKDTRLSQIG